MSNLAVKTTKPQTKPDCSEILRSIETHVAFANRYLDLEDLRYFSMRDVSQIQINLHLALELIALMRKVEATR